MRTALNSWLVYASEQAIAREAMMRAAKSLSPRARSMRKALNSWTAVWVQLRSLRRGAMALTQSGLRAGFSSWLSSC